MLAKREFRSRSNFAKKKSIYFIKENTYILAISFELLTPGADRLLLPSAVLSFDNITKHICILLTSTVHLWPSKIRFYLENFFFFQDIHNYLSYENYPILCRSASSKYYGKPAKKYVCKQTFDCCRWCNAFFYKCLKVYNFGYCIRSSYKCMCRCIDNSSRKELPYYKVGRK